ncbi:hypothetical protein Moror_1943 [Moniliophthora roreri MCA 2997]|uniref:Uncharacterized protein n=1 Tax=Moniliophthora roreri (strain MCA 2997) TaxID=1381753 RepID=V2Y7K6_MONRO|nr:hypothetical protein Moror_1943 [Moniliophthora roreri MCA 2997]
MHYSSSLVSYAIGFLTISLVNVLMRTLTLLQYTFNLPNRAGQLKTFKSIWQCPTASNAPSDNSANEFNALSDDKFDLKYGKLDPFLHYSPIKLSKQQEEKRD